MAWPWDTRCHEIPSGLKHETTERNRIRCSFLFQSTNKLIHTHLEGVEANNVFTTLQI